MRMTNKRDALEDTLDPGRRSTSRILEGTRSHAYLTGGGAFYGTGSYDLRTT